MAEFRRRVPVPRRAVVAGVNGPFDLGVNPISHLVVHIDGLVAAVTAVGVRQPYTDMTNLLVAFQGSSVINLAGVDLQAAVAAALRRVPYVWNQSSAVNGQIVRVSIVVPFGRKLFVEEECFPASKKGDLQLSMTFAAEGATFTTRNVTVEAVEMPGAVPKMFMKLVSLTRALVATDFDMPLPIGNTYAGILVFEPAVEAAGAASGTIRNLTLLLDNREQIVIGSRFEALRSEFETRVANIDEYIASAIPALGSYALIDLDPRYDGAFLLESTKYEDIRLRFELDNAGSPRVIPFELVNVPAPAGGAA